MLCEKSNERVFDFTAWWVRIIELAAVNKTCSHNQDSIEICWIQITDWG